MNDWWPIKPWACPAAEQVLPAGAPRASWLQARREMIGSSDVAKILGASKWGDSYTVWLDKTGRTPFDDGTSNAARRGQIFEDPIVQLWVERFYDHPIELRRQGLLRSKIWGRAGASVDRLSICELGHCITEIKSAVDGRQWAEDEIPLDVQFQVQWQLFVTGREHVHVVRDSGFGGIDHRIMERDDAVIKWMLDEQIAPWWQRHVAIGEPPEPTSRALDTIKRMYGNPNVGEKIMLDEDLEPTVNRLRQLNAEKADLEEQIANEEAVLRAAVGDATEVYLPSGEQIATWRPTKTIDGANKQWVKDHPDLAEQYRVTKPDIDVTALVAEHPELIEHGELRYRRSWNWT